MQFPSFLRRLGAVRSGNVVDAATGKKRLTAISAAVGDTLRKHGIPVTWIGAEALPAKAPSDTKGVHLRLIIRKTNPKLLVHVSALQQAIHMRLAQLDPGCGQWLVGTSWRLDAPAAGETCQLPGPDFWQSSSRQQAAVTESRAPAAPVTPRVPRSAREIVSRQLAGRDRAFARTTWDSPDFLPTQPVGVH